MRSRIAQTAKLAATSGITLDEFRPEFQYLVANESPPIVLLEPPRPPRAADNRPRLNRSALIALDRARRSSLHRER